MREAKKKQEAINAAQVKHFTDPDVGRRYTQLAMARFPDITAISTKAKQDGKVITSQRLTKSVTPVYPIAGRKSGVTGGVWITFVIGIDGVPQRVEWLPDPEGINDPAFVASAIAAVQQWRFEPAKLDGAPVPVMTIVPIIFQFPY